MTVAIELTRGFVALVDESDVGLVTPYSWRVHICGRLRYAKTTIAGKSVLMHRLLLGAPAGMPVDHKDGDGLNNRRTNIRLATWSGNAANCRKVSRPTTSQYKGVYWHKAAGKWATRIECRGTRTFLGLWESERAAAIAYNRTARRLFGEFARLNIFENADAPNALLALK